MPVKIRLQRHGKKGKPFYWIVAADSRAKRDGKFLEKLGIYNPNTNPATIELKVDDSVKWLQNGAQPTDTARAILSYKGALLKHHLLGGVRKGALTEEQVEEKFNAWLEEKEKAVASKIGGLDKAKADARAAALKAEKEVNDKRAAEAAAAALPETPEGESAEEVAVDTPETPQPDTENADTTPVAPVKEKEEIEASDNAAEAPSVEEVIDASDEDVKPAKTGEEE
ncbi:30S ribosomal protein S16 [Costertonia aggregata]|uniref:Small ribosomal subunit protein bS16 n=1 Tax=Costertonia aggregata TaxID=343403 RepID=A0A7H9AMS4_9FLAO|nr:30S ribosomal protein S16 [Costertonia aggregata]QLG44752.1 30S ribosomal protein S16 [Costertonia aggregata]